ncbi:MAG: RHS repeat-associated core domain-containing protein [Pirellulales bacterium]
MAVNDAYEAWHGVPLEVAAAGVLANDSVTAPSGGSAGPLTAELLYSAAHGTVSLNSDGSFIYQPYNGYLGPDQFQYVAKSDIVEPAYPSGYWYHTVTSDPATVFLQVTPPLLPSGPGALISEPAAGHSEFPRPFEQGLSLPEQATSGHANYGPFWATNQTGNVEIRHRVAPGHDIRYDSTTDQRHVILAADTVFSGHGAIPDKIAASATMGGMNSATVYYSTTGLADGDVLRFSLEIDAQSLATGYYPYTITITSTFGLDEVSQAYSGGQAVINRDQSEFGPGWTLEELDRLVIGADGVLYVFGDGTTGWYTGVNGTLLSPAGPLNSTTLVHNTDGTYTLTNKYGYQSKFTSAGLLTAHVDPNGNAYQYAYNTDDISRITDPFGRFIDFENTSGKVTKVTDFAGRVTVPAYNATDGRLETITDPDPDGGGSKPAATTTYGYGASRLLLSTVTDPLARATTIVYGRTMRLSQATRPDNHPLNFVPSQILGLVDLSTGVGTSANPAPLYKVQPFSAWSDPTGETFSYLADRYGFLIWKSDAAGNVTHFERDPHGRLTRLTLPDPDAGGPNTSPVTEYTYDAKGNVTHIVYPDGTWEDYAYSPAWNRPTSFTDRRGHSTTFTYHPDNGNLLTATDALGNVTTYVYYMLADGLPGLLKSVTLPIPAQGKNAATIQYSYDTKGRLIQITNVDGTERHLTWDPLADHLETVTNDHAPSVLPADYKTTVYDFDNLDRPRSITLPDPDAGGPLTTRVFAFDYDRAGRLVTQSETADSLTATTSYAYDPLDRLHAVTYPNPVDGGVTGGPHVEYTYDTVGRLLTQTDALGGVTHYDYNAAGRATLVTYPDPDGAGGQPAPDTHYGYDNLGRVTSMRDPTERLTTYAYDDVLRKVTVTDPAGGVTTSTYDPVGNLVSLRDPMLNTTSFVYDNLDRLTTETNQLGKSRSYGYDNVGNLIRATDRNGLIRKFDYVPGRDSATGYYPQHENWYQADGTTLTRTITYAYDATYNRLQTAADPDASYTYFYDALGRVNAVNNAGTPGAPNVFLLQTYDSFGRRNDLKAIVNSTADFWNTYAYDRLGRMTRVTQDGWGGNTVADKRVDLAYNAAGQFTTISRYANLTGTQLVAQSNYGYDLAGRLTNLDHVKGTTTLASYLWGLDAAGRVVTESSADGPTTYGYDNAGQLASASRTSETYAYDVAGNRTGGDYLTDPNNRLLRDSAYTYQYDDEGNRTKRTSRADQSSVEYSWDHRNRLTRVTYKNAQGQTTKTFDYTYDVFDRRIAKEADDDGNGTIDRAERYVYDGQHIVLEYNGAGALAHRYLYGPVVDQVLADEDPTGGVDWLLADRQGTIRDVVEYDAQLDVTNLVDHIAYNSFGKILSQTNPSKTPRFTYTGREWDADAGLYYYRARWYDPESGRFVGEDPLGFAAGDVNVQRYVGNSPVNFTDPSGLSGGSGGGSGGGNYGVAPAPSTSWAPTGFWDSLGGSVVSVGLGWKGIYQQVTGDPEYMNTYQDAYNRSPLGQTKDSSGGYYYGTRGGLTLATVSVTAAAAVGTVEVTCLANQPILVEGVSMGGKMGSGGIFQIRPTGRPPIGRLDLHPIKPGGWRIPHIDSPPAGLHHWPWQ